MDNRKIILIGGAPTAGKSTVAAAVAKYFDIPWISTDQIREVMQAAADRDANPKLFNPEGYNAERFLTEFSADEIVAMEMEQGKAVWEGVKKLIKDDYMWENGFVMEGVNILPHLVAKDFGNKENIKALFLVDEDADRMREVIFSRGLWDDADKYSDSVKEKEVEWATLFSHRIKIEAEQYGFPVVEVQKNSDDLKNVLSALGINNY